MRYETKERLAMIAFGLFFVIMVIAGIGWSILEVMTRIRFITEGAC